MKIAIDARFLTHPQPGGFKTYTENLVAALARVDRANDYLLYVDRAPRAASDLPGAPNFTCRVLESRIPLLGTAVREQILVPRQITKDQPEVVHFPCNTAPIRLPGRSVLTLHDVIELGSSRRLPAGRPGVRAFLIAQYSKWTILRAAPRVEVILTPSGFEKRQIADRLGVASDRIAVTPLAADPVFSPLPPGGCPRQDWRVEMASRLAVPARFVLGVGYEPRKNVPLLIEAFSRLAGAFPDLHLVLVAAHPGWAATFRRMAVERGLAERVLVLGGLSPANLATLYNLAEVFVFPSERESFGLPPLEAMACGTPTVAMNLTSIPEVVGDGAVLVDGTDAGAWARAIASILSDAPLRDDLAERGRRRASTLSWDRCARATLEVYRRVANQAGRATARQRAARGEVVR